MNNDNECDWFVNYWNKWFIYSEVSLISLRKLIIKIIHIKTRDTAMLLIFKQFLS